MSSIPEAIEAAKVEALQHLSETVYLCGRVWEAWSYGTMTEDDFTPAVEDDEFVDEMVRDIVTAAAPIIEARAKAEALREAADALPEWELIGLEGYYDGNEQIRAWLRNRAATIEGKSE